MKEENIEVEYKTVRKPFFVITEDWLNELGKDGWVLSCRRDVNMYIFMRHKN